MISANVLPLLCCYQALQNYISGSPAVVVTCMSKKVLSVSYQNMQKHHCIAAI